MDKHFKTRVIRLTSRLLESCISEEETKELQELLDTNEEARIIYSLMISQESILTSSMGMGNPLNQTASKIIHGNFFSNPLLAMAAALLIGFSIAWSWMSYSDFSNAENVAFLRTSPDQPAKLIKTGNYKFASGNYYLDFFSGAKMKITAPANFQILDSKHMHLKSGKLVANMNKSAHLFKITGDESSYVDLGTEFALNVNQQKKSELLVYEGEVVANTINDNGYSERIETVTANQALSYDHIEKRFDGMQVKDNQFLKYEDTHSKPITDLTDFQQSIEASHPKYYWNFDDTRGEHLVSNNKQTELTVQGDHIEQLIHDKNGAILFSEDRKFHQLTLNESMEFPANAPFSIEFLFCADRISRASIFSLFDKSSVSENGSADHFVLIETMASPEWFSHLPVSVRTVYRPIPGKDSSLGINTFTREHYVPGQWTHFAVTFDGRTLRTYQNSKLQTELKLEADEVSESASYAMIIGQMASWNGDFNPGLNYRPYIGLIDELAIYDRALKSSEIASHHRRLP